MEYAQRLDRARRNLILSSAVVLFVLTTEAHFERIGTAQITIAFNHPQNVFVWMWVVMFYFLIRYLQIFNEKERRDLKRKFLLADVRALAKEISYQSLYPKAQKLVADKKLGELVDIYPTITDEDAPFVFTVNQLLIKENGQTRLIALNIGDHILHGVPHEKLKSLWRQARTAASIKRDYFTEYYLPILMPVLPVLWLLIK